jgi:HEAT repeats
MREGDGPAMLRRPDDRLSTSAEVAVTDIGALRLAELEQALRNGNPNQSPHEAAAQLATYRDGMRLLVQVISSPGAPELREAAVYGLTFANIAPQHLVLLRRMFADPRELPGVRGQAAEVLGSRLAGFRHRWQRRYVRLVEALSAGLDDPAPEVRFWSIYALASLGERRVLPKLRKIAASDTAAVPGMWTLRQEATWAIRGLEEGDWADDIRML